MSKRSAGILAWRKVGDDLEVLLVHPGGPFYVKKDAGAWSVPKGEYEETEESLAAARREFAEELGIEVDGDFMQLSVIKQKSGKVVQAWAVEMDADLAQFRSNTFTLEWPPLSGKMKEFPEVDKAEWFPVAIAKEKINAAQVAFLDELIGLLKKNEGKL